MNRSRLLAAFLVCALSPLAGCMQSTSMRDSVAYEPAPAAKPRSSAFAPTHESAASRDVARDGSVTLEVADAEKARAQIEEKAEALGGFVEKNETARMVVRVPSARMKEAAGALAAIGRVIGGAWSAQDITAYGDDARTRIKSLQAEVARLRELLAQAKDGDAQSRLNAQLQAAQAQLDGLVAQMRAHDDKAAMATLDIRLTIDPAVACLAEVIPVAWARDMAMVLSRPRQVDLAGIQDFKSAWYSPSVKVKFPDSFTQFRDSGEVMEAVDAVGTRLRVTRHDNPGSAGDAFWFPLVRRGVESSHGVTFAGEKDLKAAGGHPARLVAARRQVGEEALAYVVATAVSTGDWLHDGHVYTVELWGTQAQVEKLRQDLETCVGTLKAE